MITLALVYYLILTIGLNWNVMNGMNIHIEFLTMIYFTLTRLGTCVNIDLCIIQLWVVCILGVNGYMLERVVPPLLALTRKKICIGCKKKRTTPLGHTLGMWQTKPLVGNTNLCLAVSVIDILCRWCTVVVFDSFTLHVPHTAGIREITYRTAVLTAAGQKQNASIVNWMATNHVTSVERCEKCQQTRLTERRCLWWWFPQCLWTSVFFKTSGAFSQMLVRQPWLFTKVASLRIMVLTPPIIR